MKNTNIRYELIIVISLIITLIFLNDKLEFEMSSNRIAVNDNQLKEFIDRPVPIDIAKKKKDRKLFKKSRKEYVDLIHKRSPELDWKKMDSDFRKMRAINNTNERQNFINQNGYWDSNNNQVVLSRDIEGIWRERGSNNLAGRVHTIDVDFENDLIYLGSSGGNIWKGTIDGENWESLNDYMQIRDIKIIRLVETDNFRRLLVGSSDGFFYTDDEGFIINQSTGLDSPLDWGEFYRFIVQGENEDAVIYTLAKEWDNGSTISIYKSIDLGVSFQKIYSDNLESNGSYDIWTSRYSNSGIFFLKEGSLYRLVNDQLIFVSEITDTYIGDNLLTGGFDQNIFMYAKINDQLYFSENEGQNWENLGTLPTYTFFRNSFKSSNINKDLISIGGIDLYKSINGGVNWSKVNEWWEYYDNPSIYLHADIPDIQFIMDNNGNEFAFVLTDGGLYVSYDGFMNEVLNISESGLGVSQYYSTYTAKYPPYKVYAGSQDQGFQRRNNISDGIYDFEQVISGDYGHLVSPNQGESIWSVYPGFVLLYPNASINSNGLTWDFQGSGYLWLPPLMEDPQNENVIYIAGGGINGGNHIIKLTKVGNSIQHEEMPFPFNNTITSMAYSPIDNSHWYAMTYNGSFYHSTDYGNSWEISLGFSGPESHYFYGSSIYPSNQTLGKVLIGGSGYSNSPVYITYNHGQNFQNFSQGLPNTMVFKIDGTLTDQVIFAATELGPYAYTDEQDEWINIMGLSAPDQTYWSLEYVPEIHTARFGTYGRGIWDFIINENIDVIYGDINQDETINIQDVILLINIILAEMDFIIEADMNNDELINVIDVVSLVNIILGA